MRHLRRQHFRRQHPRRGHSRRGHSRRGHSRRSHALCGPPGLRACGVGGTGGELATENVQRCCLNEARRSALCQGRRLKKHRSCSGRHQPRRLRGLPPLPAPRLLLSFCCFPYHCRLNYCRLPRRLLCCHLPRRCLLRLLRRLLRCPHLRRLGVLDGLLRGCDLAHMFLHSCILSCLHLEP